MNGPHGTFSEPSTPTCEQPRWLRERTAVNHPTITREEADAFALHMAACPERERALCHSVRMNEDETQDEQWAGRFPSRSPPHFAMEVPWTMLVDFDRQSLSWRIK